MKQFLAITAIALVFVSLATPAIAQDKQVDKAAEKGNETAEKKKSDGVKGGKVEEPPAEKKAVEDEKKKAKKTVNRANP